MRNCHQTKCGYIARARISSINGNILVKYPEGVKAVTEGQACVFYNGDECLGGGIIKTVYKEFK